MKLTLSRLNGFQAKRLHLLGLFVLTLAIIFGSVLMAMGQGTIPSDNTEIVPGVRIGPVMLGMSDADLLAVLGEPDVAHGWWNHWKSRNVTTYAAKGRVYRISTGETPNAITPGRFATREGIRLGDSLLRVKALLGQPSKYEQQPTAEVLNQLERHGWSNVQVEWWFTWPSGITIMVLGNTGKVQEISVHSPGFR